jgi:hypothetical protein
MSLSDLASLGSFISGVAVLVSLIFLYFQLRQVNVQVQQAEKNQQAAIQQAANHQRIDLFRDRATHPSLAEAVSLAQYSPDQLNFSQWLQFMNHTGAISSLYEDTFYQHKHGLLSDDAFESRLGTLRATVTSPAFRAVWNVSRRLYGHDYVEFIDKLVATTPVIVFDFPARFADWKSNANSEIAKAQV